jgi:hypothetical protein
MKKTCILLALSLLPLLAQSQKLGEMKDALKSSSSGGGGRGEGRNFNGGDNGDLWLDLIFQLAWQPTWWLLYGAPGEVRANEYDFNEYPYANDEDGIYVPFDYGTGKEMSLQLAGHLQSDEDAVFGGYLQAKWSPNRAINLDVNHLQLIETLEKTRTSDGGIDHFSVTNFNFSYNRVHHPKFQLWWGAGLMLLNGKGEVLYGSPSFNAGFTWYFKKPISLYADAQLGYPNSVFARQNQLRVQFHLKHFMVYAGFQGTRVGDVRLPSVGVGSVVWF